MTSIIRSPMNAPVSVAQAAADAAVQAAAALDATTKANAAQAAAIAASTPTSHVGSGGAAHALATTTVAGFLGASDKTKIDAITGTNTGDETQATIKSKLGITTLSGANTGDQTSVSGNAGTATKLETARTINGVAFDGSANIVILPNVDNTSDINKPVSTAQAAADAAVQAAAAADATTKANARQAALVSGTNIKTINGTTLLGSGDLATGDVTLVGAQTLTNKTLTAPAVNGYTEGVATASTSTAYAINITTASVQILTLTGNCTYTFPTAVAGKSFLLVQKQDATGSRTATWPAAVKWPSGTAPTLTATASKSDVFGFTCDGTSWYGRVIGSAYA